MFASCLSRSFDVDLGAIEGTDMHPTLMTMFANAQSEALRADAEARRRTPRTRGRRIFTLRRPRRVARVAHV
jgi:hypothetical protein